jgi:neopullulanase
MKLSQTFFSLCFWAFVLATATAQNGIYDNDPFQRMPLGMKKPDYYKRSTAGGTVEKARICPSNWWTGMKNPRLQLMIYDQNIKNCSFSLVYPGVKVVKIHQAENPNYLFIDLWISPQTQPGKMKIQLCGGKKTYEYELLARDRRPGVRQGLSPADNMYLIMPDRFANGDPSNDSKPGMQQTGINRDKIFFRHGGDLQGVIDRLDYIKDLGATAIWLNPVLECDEPYESYHGYATTDHYQIDARFGSNALYKEFVEKAHAKGLKVVMDIVHNHTGDQHWIVKDLPFDNWINQHWNEFTPSNYRDAVWIDPYVSEADRKKLTDGWFDNHMPDWNQRNPFVANYLLYNNIWWMEYSGQDAYRIDTYFYPEQDFMVQWGKRIQEEYPGFTFFGETWVQGLASQAQYTQGSIAAKTPRYLPGVTDFQVHFALQEAMVGRQGWTDGVNRLYITLANDFMYANPLRNVLFLDNHDTNRLLSMLNGNQTQYQSALAAMLCIRGLPCIYYGTEIGMSGAGGGFGEGGRKDFPGGWTEDKENKFSAQGRNAAEEAQFQYLRKLLNYRKNTPALHSGKTRHFIPDNGVYVFFRYNDKQRILVIWNTSDKDLEHSTSRYAEMLSGYTSAKDVVSGETLSGLGTLKVGANGIRVLELGR